MFFLNTEYFLSLFSLLILTVMNLGLFFKLWAMEDVAHRMYLSTKHRLRERSEARSDNSLQLLLFNIPISLYFPFFLKIHLTQTATISAVAMITQTAEVLVWVERGKGLVFHHLFVYGV